MHEAVTGAGRQLSLFSLATLGFTFLSPEEKRALKGRRRSHLPGRWEGGFKVEAMEALQELS